MSIDFAQRDEAVREIIQEIVKYAVFSHCWDAAGEPTYQDVTTGKHRCTAGSKKLTRFCKTAKSLGYKLAWSDTCCIDKSNMVELSETINAMFQWYSHSHLCIIHLAKSYSSSDFDHEPWFTRGWTLQELLAPRRVKFYNRTWQPLTSDTTTNDKEDKVLLSALSAATASQRPLSLQTTAKIMSWASKRKTTRVEDMAYSLIGLFRVNIRIGYGEGENAFPRLVGAIMMTRPNWDVFAWVGKASSDYPAIPCSPACYPNLTSGWLLRTSG
ncbi:heterokaryon incompatibility protein-domain-containing protein [Melanogaster broomeanus]|nr:heterokaryon incompatibility protein-domain-containing protein [Melanogaster broomeanus]